MKNKDMIINESDIDRLVHKRIRRDALCIDSRFCTKVIDDKRKRDPKYKKKFAEE